MYVEVTHKEMDDYSIGIVRQCSSCSLKKITFVNYFSAKMTSYEHMNEHTVHPSDEQ